MKIIFSRKGFDSSSGGVPSPIFPGGRMLSLPIPDKLSSIRYADLNFDEVNLGKIVSDLTQDNIKSEYFAHLDPDLNAELMKRPVGWRPVFGQTGSSRSHLQNNGVGEGDIFLYFGLFKDVLVREGKYTFQQNSHNRHILFGWLQVGDVLCLDDNLSCVPGWAEYHPHNRKNLKNNALYVSRNTLTINGVANGVAGAGVFTHYSTELQLTAPGSTSSIWKLPEWFFPSKGRLPLSYHGDISRWQRNTQHVLLKSVARGQEFVLDTDYYPEAKSWIEELIRPTIR